MKLKIFSGVSSAPLASRICQNLSVPIGKIYHHVFPSGEHYCQFLENVRGRDVFLINSICNPAHEKLMELLVMIDAAKRASAGRITVVAPYLGYLRQDRKTKSRTPITAKLAANLITTAGAERLIGLDFHCEQAQGFFDIPVDHLYGMPVFMDYLKRKVDTKNLVIVSPDAGGIKRANAFAQSLGVPFAFIAKKRKGDSEVEMQGLVGNVKKKNVVIIDDMTESCGTLIEAGKVCLKAGAIDVRGMVTHGLLNEKACERLHSNKKVLKELIVTDSVENLNCAEAVKVVSIAPLLAKAIRCINTDESVTELFDINGF